ncbi:oxidoreductase alpha (molybdopterin) subunit [Arboricoccus pini]|uniref:Oxidoreductase alpha (Molybdopterin) subunit n=1 Tax=Arboricoccus pini TaxID=1963835 RepID=A0A212QSD4_9PROT|nr:FdhF/YdeP family oxidoreductase [Arboricoccus pini]SNB62424.1 oxidoreductase alpha (molybdopterin) subunit [Arboricoccus pini]
MSGKAKIKAYKAAAGGLGALEAVERHLCRQKVFINGNRALLQMNQPEGFDCPGCGWPDPSHTSSFEYCENGAKAVAWEATKKRTIPAFFAEHTVSELLEWSDFALEDQGRLTHPMVYDPATDRYVETSWDEAYALIGRELNKLPDPNMVEFYTSGRASNEAAFMFQLFARAWGTNNFPDCSNMCHESTSVALPQSIGVAKGTIVLEDFEKADAIFIFGQNPGTNSPRMLNDLRAAAKRGAEIIVFNPLRERALERFASPQHVADLVKPVQIATQYHQVRVGGDLAAIKGIMKAVLEADAEALAEGRPSILDRQFIATHTTGFEAVQQDVERLSWAEIVRESGLTKEAILTAAGSYIRADAVIAVWGMGITQHRTGVANIQQIVNLLMLRGNLGKPGAGCCPVRGHSNVQGDRTVGIYEKPKGPFLDGLQRTFGFVPPRDWGHDVVEAIEAMVEGHSKAFIGLGGNFLLAAPDTEVTAKAMRGLDLTVQIATKLNRGHLVHGKVSLLLPCLGRTEMDYQASGPQSVTVEDSMSCVHASAGRNFPASRHLRSEVSIICGMAKATLPASLGIDWDGFTANYDRIRDAIESTMPDLFAGYNAKIRQPGGFRLYSPVDHRIWKTPNGKANFIVHDGIVEDDMPDNDTSVLNLTTIRSHDQYNTTIYGLDDRYRGVFGQRMVVFVNKADRERLGFAEGAMVAMRTVSPDGQERRVGGFRLVDYDIPAGCAAAYYPETNPLVPLHRRALQSNTPTSKSVPVVLEAWTGTWNDRPAPELALVPRDMREIAVGA